MTATEDLIRRLAADPRPAPPVSRGLAARLSPALLVAFLLMAAILGLRSGLMAAFSDPVVALKAVLPALAATASPTSGIDPAGTPARDAMRRNRSL